MYFDVFKHVRDISFRISLSILVIYRFLFAFIQFMQIFMLIVAFVPAEYMTASGI